MDDLHNLPQHSTANATRDSVEVFCIFCQATTQVNTQSLCSVHPNVKEWSDETFHFWRCTACKSIHLWEKPDLDRYYKNYLFSHPSQKLNGAKRKIFRNFFSKRGVPRGYQGRVLDYGCGSGTMLDFLREWGCSNVYGYDPYSAKYASPLVLQNHFDLIVLQDVVEHVADPRKLIEELTKLLAPGGRLVIGTPRAEGIDFSKPESAVHMLHAPYHLHIPSEKWLIEYTKSLSLACEQVRHEHIIESGIPFHNWNFVRAYTRRFNNTIDSLIVGPVDYLMILSSPELLWTGLFGHFLPQLKQNMILVFRAE